MITIGEFVSRVANGLRALSKDAHISSRYIYHIGKVKAKYLMGQKLDELTLFKEDGLITNIDCFRLKRVKSKDCEILEFALCDIIMKSCEKLPEGLFGKNGSSIFSVMNVDGSKEYRYITPRRYADIKKRKYIKKGSAYFYIRDEYLYLLDTKNELVDISMIVLDKDEAVNVSECNSKEKTGCSSKLDLEFICPDRFLDIVVRDTIQEVGSFYRTSVPDENPNMDEHQKTQTTK